MGRICSKCHSDLPLSEFYRHPNMADGYLNKCKSCKRAEATLHRNTNLEAVRLYDRRRGKRPYKTKAEVDRRAQAKYVKRNPEKSAARRTAQAAIRKGILCRKPCAVCGVSKAEGHHPDYSKPLDLIWLCKRHHGEAHRRMER